MSRIKSWLIDLAGKQSGKEVSPMKVGGGLRGCYRERWIIGGHPLIFPSEQLSETKFIHEKGTFLSRKTWEFYNIQIYLECMMHCRMAIPWCILHRGVALTHFFKICGVRYKADFQLWAGVCIIHCQMGTPWCILHRGVNHKKIVLLYFVLLTL